MDGATGISTDGGFKLVTDKYAPLFGIYDGGQRYKVGTTQWICSSDKPTCLKLCTPSALHYCERAIDTTAFVSSANLTSLRLLRVTPVRWCPLSQRDANGNPLTKCEKEDDDDDSLLPLFVTEPSSASNAKRGAHGLRVDGEVTGAERDAALSGVRTTRCGTFMKFVNVLEKGVPVEQHYVDVLGNTFDDTYVGRSAHRRAYVLGQRIFYSVDMLLSSSEWKDALGTAELFFATLVPHDEVLKRYSKAEFLTALSTAVAVE